MSSTQTGWKFFMTRNHKLDQGHNALKPWQSFVSLVNYFAGLPFLYPILSVVLFGGIKDIEGTIELEPAIVTYAYVFALIVGVVPLLNVLWKSLQDFFNQHHIGRNLLIILKNIIFYFVFNIVFAIVIDWLRIIGTSANQSALESMYASAPYMVLFMTMIIAPLLEETVFRGAIFGTLRKHGLYIWAHVISALIFGFIHVANALFIAPSWAEVVFWFQYAMMGFFMSMTYEETGSIWGGIFMHFIMNAMASLVMVFG